MRYGPWMLTTAICVLVGLTCLSTAAVQDPDPHRQFDFWVGEWSVQNRNLQADGTWKDGDVTRARITPVCGGKALLEEWAGPFHGGFMNGFSLRSFEPEAGRWTILLFWTMDGNGGFGRMHGSFRHGRGEFFSNTTEAEQTRYTFSDGLADSVRWDQAFTKDAGQGWRTDWIMEFSRTRAAAVTTQASFFESEWTTGKVSSHAEARQLDFLLGSWAGEQTLPDGAKREARLSCKLVNKDCLVVDLLETRAPGVEGWDERLAVRGFEVRSGAWASWSLSEQDPVMARAAGQVLEGGLEFTHAGASAWPRQVERIVRGGEGLVTITLHHEERVGAEQQLLSTTVLKPNPR